MQIFNMFASVATHQGWGWVVLCDRPLRVNMARQAKGGFSTATVQET
jgi:hypothetical protein